MVRNKRECTSSYLGIIAIMCLYCSVSEIYVVCTLFVKRLSMTKDYDER